MRVSTNKGRGGSVLTGLEHASRKMVPERMKKPDASGRASGLFDWRHSESERGDWVPRRSQGNGSTALWTRNGRDSRLFQEKTRRTREGHRAL